MSEVKRYSKDWDVMVTNKTGDWVKYYDHLAAMEAKDREIEGLYEFLEQIVKVNPEGKDLWIQTVKIRAAQYLDAKEPK